jgi:conjugal transfer pilus assembly protein TraE
MKTYLSQTRLNVLLHHRYMLVCGCAVLSTVSILEGIALIFKSEHVVIVPPELTQSFWIEKNRASSAYLEEMGLFFISLILDNSPASSAYQRDIILRYALPQNYSALKAQLLSDEARLKKENLSTHFRPLDVKVSQPNNHVEITGDLMGFVGDKKIFQARETYLLVLLFKKGRLFIQSFKCMKSPRHV